MPTFNNLCNKILEQMGAQQQPNNGQPQTTQTTPTTTNTKPLDTKSLADQISKLDPNKLDPKHQELLSSLQALLGQATSAQPAPTNPNAAQPNQNTQKPM